jgi:hypothetical protein
MMLFVVFTSNHSSKPYCICHRTVKPLYLSWAGYLAGYQYKLPSLSQGTDNFVHARAETESNLHCPGIHLGSFDLPIELTKWYQRPGSHYGFTKLKLNKLSFDDLSNLYM